MMARHRFHGPRPAQRRYPLNEQDSNAPVCQCGCGRPVGVYKRTNTASGQVKGQPIRYLTGHQRRSSPVDYIEDENGCWIWQRHVLPGGYGLVTGRSTAHRVYYEKFVGPIPEGFDVHHKCEVRACVNPDHLEPMARRPHRRLDRRTKLTLELAREIKNAPRTISQRKLAKQYGVSPELVYGIRSGRKWPDA